MVITNLLQIDFAVTHCTLPSNYKYYHSIYGCLQIHLQTYHNVSSPNCNCFRMQCGEVNRVHGHMENKKKTHKKICSCNPICTDSHKHLQSIRDIDNLAERRRESKRECIVSMAQRDKIAIYRTYIHIYNPSTDTSNGSNLII